MTHSKHASKIKTEFIIRGHILMIPPLKFAIIELKGDRLASGNIN